MRRITGLAMATLLALAVGACGGDDDSSSEAPTTTAPAGDDGSASDDGSTDAAAAAGLVDEDCQFLVAGAFLNPLAGAMSGAEDDFDESAAQLEAIAEEAPEEIQDAMATISDAFSQMADALKDVDLDDPQSFADPQVQAAFQDLEDVFDEEYEQASQTVSDYVAENCSG